MIIPHRPVECVSIDFDHSSELAYNHIEDDNVWIYSRTQQIDQRGKKCVNRIEKK